MLSFRSSIFPHHIPLFDICSKYLLMNKLEYSLMNIRRIVSAVSIAYLSFYIDDYCLIQLSYLHLQTSSRPWSNAPATSEQYSAILLPVAKAKSQVSATVNNASLAPRPGAYAN